MAQKKRTVYITTSTYITLYALTYIANMKSECIYHPNLSMQQLSKASCKHIPSRHEVTTVLFNPVVIMQKWTPLQSRNVELFPS